MFRTLSLSSVLLVTSLAAFAAEPETKPDTSTDRPHVKAFRLKTANPNDALEAFNTLMGRQANAVPVAPQGLEPIPPPLPAPGAPPAPLPSPRLLRGLTPATYSTASTPTVAPPPVSGSALADPRTRSLIVRGTEKDLQLAADLVAVLNTPEDKPLPAVKTLKAFRFQHLDTKDFVGIMEALDPNIGYRMAPVGSMKLLLAVGSDEQMKELAEAVKELDTPSTTK